MQLIFSHIICSQQAYISSFWLFPLDGNLPLPPAGPGVTAGNSELTVILVASSADPMVFKELLRGKKYIETV